MFFATACDGGTIGGLQTPGREKGQEGCYPWSGTAGDCSRASTACPSSPSQEQRRMQLGIRNPGSQASQANHVHMTSNFSLVLLEGMRDASASLVSPLW